MSQDLSHPINTAQAAKYLTPKQLSARWQCSTMKLRRMRRAGKLPVSYIGRSARYDIADVQRIETEAAA